MGRPSFWSGWVKRQGLGAFWGAGFLWKFSECLEEIEGGNLIVHFYFIFL